MWLVVMSPIFRNGRNGFQIAEVATIIIFVAVRARTNKPRVAVLIVRARNTSFGGKMSEQGIFALPVELLSIIVSNLALQAYRRGSVAIEIIDGEHSNLSTYRPASTWS